MKKVLSLMSVIGMVFTMAVAAHAEEGKDISKYTVVMIVKQSDPWFDDMERGVNQLAKDTGLNRGDAALLSLEDLLFRLTERLRTMTPREDYDVLYITANAAVSAVSQARELQRILPMLTEPRSLYAMKPTSIKTRSAKRAQYLAVLARSATRTVSSSKETSPAESSCIVVW